MNTRFPELPIPPFYNAQHASEWHYRPDQQLLFEQAGEWRRQHGVRPAASDAHKVHLLLIDEQKDFCFPEGSLYVAGRSGRGALEDNDRVARFIYRNLGRITDITCTMDTHFAFQIFFPSFWVDQDDHELQAHREISVDDIRSGRVKPRPSIASWLCNGNYPWLLKQVEFYCAQLEQRGKYKLYLWPPHCILGSDGHALAGVIHEARLFHAYTRGAKAWIEVKGGNTLTENYSVLAPEVLERHDRQPLAQRNTQFIQTLLESDMVLIAGQAASHCVRSSIEDLLNEIKAKDESLARKVYILRDCMSAVAVADPSKRGAFLFDFTTQAEDALDRFAAAGMHVVSSTDAMESWPGLQH